MMPEDLNNSMHWQALIAKLMQCISLVPPVNSPKDDKITDRVARHDPKTYGGSYDPMKLEEWIRSIEKILAMTKFLRKRWQILGHFT